MQAIQIPSTSYVYDKNRQEAAIDPELLFQRLITECSKDDLGNSLKHELSSQPMTIFTDDGFMRDPKKSELAKYIVSEYIFDDVIPNISGKNWKNVINGGMLLHKLP